MTKQLLPIKELTQLEKDILDIISTSEISSPIEIARLLDLDESEIIPILNNDEFYNLICARSLSHMRLAYHSKAIPKLIEHLDNEHKFYDSYDRLTKAIGAVKDKDSEGLKVSLEVLLKDAKIEKKEKKANPDLNTVSKPVELKRTSGNIFAIEEESKPESPHKQEMEFEFEE
jgi:hypothetical protein